MQIRSKRTLAVTAATLALAGGAAGGALAVQGGSAARAAGDPPAELKAEHQAFLAAVAKRLGVSTQALEDALRGAALERLDAAVAAGKIDKERADRIRERIESGELVPLGPGGFRGGHRGMAGKGLFAEAAAAYLGLSVTQLHEKLRAGRSLADVTKAQGKSVDGLKQAMLDDAKKRFDEAVAAGRLTAAQAKEMLGRLEAKLDDIVNDTHSGPPAGGPGFDRPGFGGPGFGPGFGFRHDRFGGPAFEVPAAGTVPFFQ